MKKNYFYCIYFSRNKLMTLTLIHNLDLNYSLVLLKLPVSFTRMNVFVLIATAAQNCIPPPLRCLHVHYVVYIWISHNCRRIEINRNRSARSPQKLRYSNKVHDQWSEDVSKFNSGVYLWSYLCYRWWFFLGELFFSLKGFLWW